MAGYLGSTPVPQATQHRESFTATSGQTTFASAGYTAGFVDVYLNGSHLSPADFTATNGSDVVLASGASADDVCDIISYTAFEIADQTFTGTTTMTDVVAASLDISGNIDIDGTTNLDIVDIDGAVNMATTALVTGVLTTTASAVFNGGFTSNGDTVTLTSSAQDDPVLVIQNTTNDSNSARLKFVKDRGAAAQDGDDIADILFVGENDAQEAVTYAAARVEIIDASDGTEDGRFKLETILAGASVDRMQCNSAETIFNQDSKDLDFRIETNNNVHALFVNSAGDGAAETVCVGTSDTSVAANTGSAKGINLNITNGYIEVAAYQQAVAYFNRLNNDGTIIILSGNGSTEGTISVSGSTISYNGFSGRHESSGIPANTPVGTVVSTIDTLDVYPNNTTDTNGNAISHLKAGQTRSDHAQVEVSTSEGDACVYGVVSEFDTDGKLIVTSVGIGSVRVTGSCAKGDLLESNGDGTAKVQSDDIVRSKTIGKVTIGNSSTGVKLVSCVMYCG